jgi:GATA-binding protein
METRDDSDSSAGDQTATEQALVAAEQLEAVQQQQQQQQHQQQHQHQHQHQQQQPPALQRPPTEQISAGLASTNESSQPTCTNCSTSTTPLWRRDVEGAVLCNACGLFLKLHKRPRPISLKTDVIKSRNRIKTARPMPPNSKKKTPTQHPPGFNVTTDPNGMPISHQMAQAQKALHDHDGTGSPVPNYPHNLTHFPEIDGHFPVFSIPGASPGGTSPHNGDHRGDGAETQESLMAANSTLKTRISELELIHELYRGRLSQLENDQAQFHQQLESFREADEQLRAELTASHNREMALKHRLEEILGIQEPHEGEASLKRRFDDVMEGQDTLVLDGGIEGHHDENGGDKVAEAENAREREREHSPAKRFKPDVALEASETVVDPSMQATLDDEEEEEVVEQAGSPMDHAPAEAEAAAEVNAEAGSEAGAEADVKADADADNVAATAAQAVEAV